MSNKEIAIWLLALVCSYAWGSIAFNLLAAYPSWAFILQLHICVATVCTAQSAIEEAKRAKGIRLRDLL